MDIEPLGNRALLAVDRLEITLILDNVIDGFLTDTAEVKRAQLPDHQPWGERPALIAEHGFAALIKAQTGSRSTTLLFDAGLTTFGLMHNIDTLGIDPASIDAIVLSHGHVDHTQGLMGLFRRMAGRRVPVLLHPHALLNRKLVFPGQEIMTPPPNRQQLESVGADIIEMDGPALLGGGLVMTTGEIERHTSFEKGLPVHYSQIDGEWQHDPVIHDDQALIIHVRGKGLVVITGCGHAGAINTLNCAIARTGVETIYGFLGGLHLTGKLFEPIIPQTVDALRQYLPRLLMPCHCTGWKATQALSLEFPDNFVPTSVGTTLVITASPEGPST